jgi:pentalenolactone synthase
VTSCCSVSARPTTTPGRCPTPDRFDIRRKPNRHSAFGRGFYSCLGASLARLELQSAYGTLARRLPDLRIAVPVDDLRLRETAMYGGLRELPVTW